MPYINMEVRDKMSEGQLPRNVGELNYAITSLILDFLPETPRYSDYNSVIGVLECAKLEYYRRIVASYEIQKCYENGDVF